MLSYCSLLFFNLSLLLILKYSLGIYIFHNSSQNLQKVRIATHSNFAPHRLHYFRKLNFLQYMILTIKMGTIQEGKWSRHFGSYYKTNSHIHSCSTRKSSNLHLPKHLASRGQFLNQIQVITS